MAEIGKMIIIFGVIIIIVGIFVIFSPKIPFIGKLPGDIYIKKGNFTFYSPIVTSIIISIILTIIVNFFFRR